MKRDFMQSLFCHRYKVGVIIFAFVLIGIASIFLWIDYYKNFDVDLVYLWCDGAESGFATRKAYWQEKQGKKLEKNAVGSGRFLQVDELKYSLRSVEKHLPWIRHIFIVTDRQVPPWLKVEHPKITVVDHSEIIPAKYIPIFNSTAIESRLHKIPGLSEHFLFVNDDMFFNRSVDRHFFFPERGKIYIRFKELDARYKNFTWYRIIANAFRLFEEDFGPVSPFSEKTLEPHHNVDAYLKSDYEACMTRYDKVVQEMLSHRFRENTDVQRTIVSLFSFKKNHGILLLGVPDQSKNTETLKSWYFDNRYNGVKDYYDALLRFKTALFCINDTEDSSQENRENVRKFLDNYFPNKSQFEK